MFDRSINVYWAPSGGRFPDKKHIVNQSNLTWFEPEPVINSLIKNRNKYVEYFKCPAFLDYYKNTFLIRCPFDLKISIEKIDGKRYIHTHNYDKEFYNNFIREDIVSDDSNFFTFSIANSYVFYSDDSVIIEQIPATLSYHITETLQNLCLIPGKYDIGKWIRPLESMYEVIDDSKEIILKRGDPLYYFRLNTEKKINLIRTEYNDTIVDMVQSCTSRKVFSKNSSMQENYDSAKSLLHLYRKKLFPSKKCPFGFKK